jgi:hypothetical protein
MDITIEQGATFDKKINWYAGGKVFNEIEGVTVGCPTRVTITSHGLPASADTPVEIQGVKGARSLNTKGKKVVATYVDADTFDVPLDTVGEVYETGTGCMHYIAPKALASYTARMDIRESLDDTTPLVSLTSVGGDIVIDTATAEIQIIIADEVTAALDFDEGVYDLELESGTGVVTRLIEGKVAFVKEVTRP